MTTTLYRSRTEKMLFGVCGGLGAYLGIDPTFVRLFFVLLTLGNGIGLMLYAVLAFLMPVNPVAEPSGGSPVPFWENERAVRLAGISLVVVGFFAFLPQVMNRYFGWLELSDFWPALLILGGAVMLVRALRQDKSSQTS
ncbi:MAG: PspC domain-containing protein [Anaerolineae bacterium]|nr:MAG: PspC domain-containing protein [Anaerolineae bacterium]